MSDGEVDRRQRTRGQNGAGDDHPRGGLLIDNQIGTDPHHGRLQHHAQHARKGAQSGSHIGGSLVSIHVAHVGGVPTCGQAGRHGHSFNSFGISPAGLGKRQPVSPVHGRGLGRSARQYFSYERERDEHDRPRQRGGADPEVKGKAQPQIERHPGEIEQRGRPQAG